MGWGGWDLVMGGDGCKSCPVGLEPSKPSSEALICGESVLLVPLPCVGHPASCRFLN